MPSQNGWFGLQWELWRGGGGLLRLSKAPSFLDYQLQSPSRCLWDGNLLPRTDGHQISLCHSSESTYNTCCNTQGPAGLSVT